MRKFLILFITIWMFGCNNQNSSSPSDSSMPHPKNTGKDVTPPLPPSI